MRLSLPVCFVVLCSLVAVQTGCGAEDNDASMLTQDVGGATSDAGLALDASADSGDDTITSSPDTSSTDGQDSTSAVSDARALDTQSAQDTDAGSSDASSSSDTGPSNADTGGGASGPTGKEFNQGFIGGACGQDSQCAYANGFCAMDSEGFPNGMCSAPCTKFCPDQAGMATTFCVTSTEVGLSNPPGMCTVRCDFGKSPTGCRPGYSCVKMQRFNDPSTAVMACVPGTSGAGVQLTQCQELLVAQGVGFSPLPNPKAVPKGSTAALCQIDEFLSVQPDLQGVGFRASSPTGKKSPMKVNCGFAHALIDMAKLLKAQGVKEVVHYGTYNCRFIGGTTTLSEHGFANAIDIAGFVMKDGTYYSVLKDWEKGVANPKTDAGKVLKWFADTMYAKHIFNVILTPEYNAAHADHFHVDLTPGSWFKQGFAEAHPGCTHPAGE